MSERIKVSTEILKEKSSEWLEVAETAGKELICAENIMESMQTSFHAKAEAHLQKAFKQLIEKSIQHVNGLCDHLKNLSCIAENYEEAEKENESVITDH